MTMIGEMIDTSKKTTRILKFRLFKKVELVDKYLP